jgi:putative DNA primase/helicase
MDIDFASLIVPVVRRLRGNPNEELSTREVLRWGNKGSLAVKVKEGVWYDHEMKEGGGCLDFIRRHNNGDPFEWLRQQHLIESDALVATFDYRNEQNKLLYQVCRKANKGFWQRQPNGSGNWINNIKGVRRVLYRLPELLASTTIVFIPEGEKHVDALIKMGLCATCNVGGAGKGKWRKEYNEFLRGRDVVVLPDNDKAGQDHSENIARNLSGIARRVRLLMLPGLKHKGDVINWLEAGGTREQLEQLVEDTAVWEETQSGNPEDGGNHDQPDMPQAAILVGLAQVAELFHTPERKAYADIKNDGHRETWAVRSRDFKLWLGRAFFQMQARPRAVKQ